MKHRLFLFLAILFCFNAAHATSDTVSTDITADTLWATDTIFVDADILIDSGAVLTIAPGTKILFTDFYEIQVSGRILSVGTSDLPIVFSVQDTSGFSTFSHTGWNGITFDNTYNDSQQDTSYFVYNCFHFASEYDDSYGGGVFRILYFSKVIIDHCLFSYNYADYMGGAIGIQYDSNPVIAHCLFEYNYAAQGGGAINIGCGSSSEVSTPYIFNNVFRYNECMYSSTYYGGGALKISGYSQALVVNNLITENSCSDASGGGGVVISGYSSPVLINNVITSNTAVSNGGGVMIRYYTNPVLINNTIANNHTQSSGGGIANGCSTDSLKLYNNIVYGNTADVAGNQIFINNDDDCAAYQIVNNLIEGGIASFGLGDTLIFAPISMNTISDDPMFADATNGVYTLNPCSPAINAGLNAAALVTEDFSGMPRIFETTVDMGAYEYQYVQNYIRYDTLGLCMGDSLYLEGAWQMASGDFEDAFTTTTLHCDSTVYTHLTVNDLPVVDLGADQTIHTNESTTLDAGLFAGYLWSDGSSSQQLVLDGAVLGTGVFDYSVIVTDDNGCMNSDTIVVTVEIPVGIEDLDAHVLSIYPNPSGGLFTIESDCRFAEITDINGRIITVVDFGTTGTQSIDIRSYDKGMYFVSCHYNDNIIVRKISVK